MHWGLVVAVDQEVLQSSWVIIYTQVLVEEEYQELYHCRYLLNIMGILFPTSKNISIQYFNLFQISGWT